MIQTISSTELARNLSRLLDRLAAEGGELIIERNERPVARLVSVPAQQTAIEAMSDLY